MGVRIGGGWELMHLTDRVVELRKDDPVYRRMTGGRDGYVRLLGERGIDRATMLERARQAAIAQDDKATEFVAKDIIPRNLRGYLLTTHGLARNCQTGEEPEIIGRKRLRG